MSYPQPPYPQQPPTPNPFAEPATTPEPAWLHLHLQGSKALMWVDPTVFVSGWRARATYGENRYPLVPGTHLVMAQQQWMWEYGRAEQQVTLRPGERVDLWYASPWLTFLPGSMGFEKQKRKGRGVLLAGGLLLLLLVLLAVVIASILGAS